MSQDIKSKTHKFTHNAMATVFEIFILNEDKAYGGQAAQAAFKKLDLLELELSRFIENSDISKINSLQANSSTRVGPATFQCLQQCAQICKNTGGAFDITVGSLYDCWCKKTKSLQKPSKQELNYALERTGMSLLKMDRKNFTVQVMKDNMKLDLGGVGKGYAVDQMVKLLGDWGIKTALIHGGASSVYALGAPPDSIGWPLTISNPGESKDTLEHIYLSNQAMSGSGLHQKGGHIINPGTAQPLKDKIATWTIGPGAALCDALSTAFMVMSRKEIKNYCSIYRNVKALIADPEFGKNKKRELFKFGLWD